MWQSPTEYDMVKHGPPFLPVKLSSDQKAAIHKQAAAYDARPVYEGTAEGTGLLADPYHPLAVILAALQTASLVHQSHHWRTRGTAFYADHLLFERLYNEGLEFIDSVAERAIGASQDVRLVNPLRQVHLMDGLVKTLYGTMAEPEPNDMVRLSYDLEVRVLALIKTGMAELEQSGCLSHGISNLLEGAADKHEVFIYLLGQRKLGPQSYSYDRG